VINLFRSLGIKKERRSLAVCSPCIAKVVLAAFLNPIAVRQVVKAMISAMIGYVSSSKSRK
jgi:hypothetical protein